MLGSQAASTITVLAVVFLTACGTVHRANSPQKTGLSTPEKRTQPAGGVAARFVGTEWQLTSLHGHDLIDGTNITLEIDREEGEITLGGSATCNEYGSFHATMREGVLRSGGIGYTEVGCSGNRGEQENAYLDALGSAVSYQVRGDTLEVQDSKGKTTLVYRQEKLSSSDSEDLAGSRWLLRSVGGSPVSDDFPVAVTFDTEKAVSGYDGCLHFTGQYFANENDLAIPNYGYEPEDKYCLKPGAYGRTPRSSDLEEILVDEKNYSLDNGRLTVRDDSGTVSVYAPLREDVKVETPGRAWVLEKSVEGHRATPVLDDTRITLRFDRGTLRTTGTMSGSAGCNTYVADYKLDDDFVTATPRVITKKVCSTPDGVMKQEQRYLSRLEKGTYLYTPNIEGQLEVSSRDGEREMVFGAPE